MGQEPALSRIGDYQILDVIGQGGMGVVYRAQDTTIGRTVAIKMLKGAYAEDADLLKRFYREARATGNLQHKNIVTVYSLGDRDGTPYLVIEYLDGESMAQIIASRKPMNLVDKLDLVIQVCDGLQYAHQRDLVHRDIKPANILVTKDGTAKIVDFGIARMGGGEGLTQTGQLVGSMFYMSPEQINGLAVDGRSDIFSTGVMLYEFLTYNLPFKGPDATTTFMKILRDPPPPLSTYISDYPPELDEIMARALDKQVDDRYQSAEEFGFDLIQVQDKLKRGMTSEFLQNAETALQRGDVERARLHLQEILKLDRQNTKANELLRQVRQTVQKQQRAAQVAQLRSQAEVALSSAQFEEALACAEQALRLNPEDTESIRLRDHVKETIARVQSVRDAMSRAESALYAGDLDEANAAIQEALRLNPELSEAKALNAVVERELAERARRQKVQGYVERARRDISERNFSQAIASLHEAETLDPTDSNIRELLHWASKGQEQERRRKELQEINGRIDEAMRQQDFASAVNMCDMALQRFPEEASLLKLKSLAERQLELLERRKYVQDQSLAARRLADEGKHEEVVKLITAALQRYPGEPNLQTLLALSSAEIERTNRQREEDTRLQQEQARQAWKVSRQQLLDLCGDIRRLLDQNEPIDSVAPHAEQLSGLLATTATDEDVRHLALPLLLDFETRRNTRDQSLRDLDHLRETSAGASPSDTALRGSYRERAEAIAEQFPRDKKIGAAVQQVLTAIEYWRNARDAALRELTSLSASMADATPAQAQLFVERAREIADPYSPDPQFGALIQQIQHESDRRAQAAGRVLQDLQQLRTSTQAARSMSELAQILQRAQSIASAEIGDHRISEALLQLQEVANYRRGALQATLREAQDLAQRTSSAATVAEAEAVLESLKVLVDKNSDNADLQTLWTRVSAQVHGRRVEHDLIVQELEALVSSITLGMPEEDLLAAEARASECSERHPNDAEIQTLCTDLQEKIGVTRNAPAAEANLAPSATMIAEPGRIPQTANRATGTATAARTAVRKIEPPAPAPAAPASNRRMLWIATAALAVAAVAGGAWWFSRPTPLVEVGAQTDPAGATVHIGNQSCTAPCTLNLKAGNYTLSAELDGYEKVQRKVDIRGNTTESISLAKVEAPITIPSAPSATGPAPALTPVQPAHLQVSGVPALAQVMIDGKLAGKASRSGDFSTDVPPGDHQIKTIAGSQSSTTITRNFRPGATTSLNPAAFAPPAPPQPAEQVEWQTVKDSRSLADVDRFLQHYPNGTYQSEARAKLEDLQWDAARSGGSANSIRSYLNLYPNGRYAAQANSEMAKLDWQQVQSSRDPGKLEDFLRRYPSGEYHDKASAQLDDLTWQSNVRQDDPASLRGYLQQFPNGHHADAARKAIDQLARAANPPRTVQPTPAPPPAAPSVPMAIDDRTAIRNTLAEFEKAYEAEDVSRLQRIWPNMGSDKMKEMTNFFKNSTNIKLVNSLAADPEIKGNEATAKCSQDLTFNDGKATRHYNAKVTMKLKKVSEGSQPVWQIESIR